MSTDYYYEGKKAKFGNLFSKDADENTELFLKYVAIEINREMLGELSDLKDSISDLKDSINNRES